MIENAYHFKFKDLLVDQKAIVFKEKINELAEDFPNNKMNRLSSQYARSADFITAFISDGYSSAGVTFNSHL